ncbi:MAG TPA: amino acid ABC transporter substrate-binding protein [Stellaceae bacterium]|nr:amino acid ABC transporter substrate-binding protein [Stellaceae bacterium]
MSIWNRAMRAALTMLALVWLALPAHAADPIKIGFSIAETGGTAGIGKQILIALQIWRDDVNAKGGLLGRPIELVHYDDQGNPANAAEIYSKLLDIDKVDLLIGPYSTNMVAPVIPILMQRGLTTIGILANAANSQFHYDRYFSMIPSGPDPEKSFSTGFFQLAAAQTPKPKTLAILGVDAEFGRNATDGARANLKNFGFQLVYDQNYPPNTTDFTPIVRAVQAKNPDIVYVAAYPPDTVGIVRAMNEVGFAPKMFGGAFIGLMITATKVQLGPLLNGVVITQGFLPAPTFNFPGVQELLAKYAQIAPKQGLDPLGWSFPPYGYAAGQVLQAAVEGTKSLDHAKLAAYMRSHEFSTVVGKISFGKDGEWAKGRAVWTQFQHVTGNTLSDFKDVSHQPILLPPEMKTGNLIYPYAEAKKP